VDFESPSQASPFVDAGWVVSTSSTSSKYRFQYKYEEDIIFSASHSLLKIVFFASLELCLSVLIYDFVIFLKYFSGCSHE
jgi:hypothetical protein